MEHVLTKFQENIFFKISPRGNYYYMPFELLYMLFNTATRKYSILNGYVTFKSRGLQTIVLCSSLTWSLGRENLFYFLLIAKLTRMTYNKTSTADKRGGLNFVTLTFIFNVKAYIFKRDVKQLANKRTIHGWYSIIFAPELGFAPLSMVYLYTLCITTAYMPVREKFL